MKASYNDFEIICIEKDVILMWECVRTAAEIDFHIDNKQHFIALHFTKKATTIASFFGFLTERIQKLHKIKGELIIIAENPELKTLIQTAHIDSIVPIYNSIKEFISAYPSPSRNRMYTSYIN